MRLYVARVIDPSDVDSIRTNCNLVTYSTRTDFFVEALKVRVPGVPTNMAVESAEESQDIFMKFNLARFRRLLTGVNEIVFRELPYGVIAPAGSIPRRTNQRPRGR